MKKRLTFFIGGLFLLGLTGLKGQEERPSRADAEHFMAYFNDSIRYGADFQVCQELYKWSKEYDGLENKYAFMEDREHITANPVMRDDAERRLLDRIIVLTDVLQSRMDHAGKALTIDKETAKRLIKRFGEESCVQPTFYQLIAEKYKGDVDAYVDDLYEKSILTNADKMKKFRRNPSHRKLRKDPGILYTISKLQYMGRIHCAGYDDLLER